MQKNSFLRVLVFLILLFSNAHAKSLAEALQDNEALAQKNKTLLEKNQQLIQDNSSLIKYAINPWSKSDTRLIDLLNFKKPSNVFGCNPKVQKKEFMISRNDAFRKLIFSNWNGGCRAMTEHYFTGDSKENFRLGGSVFIYNTRDPRDNNCLYHLYYYSNQGGTRAMEGNGCTQEAQIYERNIIFTENIEGLSE